MQSFIVATQPWPAYGYSPVNLMIGLYDSFEQLVKYNAAAAEVAT